MPYQTSAVAIQHQSLDSYPNGNMRMWVLSVLVYEHEQEHICCLMRIIKLYVPPPVCWAILMWHFLTQLISCHKASCKLTTAAICAFNGPCFFNQRRSRECKREKMSFSWELFFKSLSKPWTEECKNVEPELWKYNRKGKIFIAVPLKLFIPCH